MGFTQVGLLFLAVCANSPFGHVKDSLRPVSPLTVAALFLREQGGTGAMDAQGMPAQALRALLVPGYAWREALQGGGRGLGELHESAVEIATEDSSSWWAKAKRQDLFVTGSSFCIFGAFTSLLTRRMHFLALIGLLLFGASMMINSPAPSVQYLVCCAVALLDISSRIPQRVHEKAD